MPFKDFNLKSAFDESYSIGTGLRNTTTGQELKLNYHRAVLRLGAADRATGIINAMNWTDLNMATVIGGAGFSWLAEAFEDFGFTTVVGVDISTYIQGNKNGTEEIELDGLIAGIGLDPATGEGLVIKNVVFDGGIRTRASRGVLNANAALPAQRNQIRNALGLSGNQTPDVILSESVLENLTDQEAIDQTAAVRTWGPPLTHYVVTTRSGNIPNEFNWKTLGEWKTLLPLDTFIEAGTFEVL